MPHVVSARCINCCSSAGLKSIRVKKCRGRDMLIPAVFAWWLASGAALDQPGEEPKRKRKADGCEAEQC